MDIGCYNLIKLTITLGLLSTILPTRVGHIQPRTAEIRTCYAVSPGHALIFGSFPVDNGDMWSWFLSFYQQVSHIAEPIPEYNIVWCKLKGRPTATII